MWNSNIYQDQDLKQNDINIELHELNGFESSDEESNIGLIKSEVIHSSSSSSFSFPCQRLQRLKNLVTFNSKSSSSSSKSKSNYIYLIMGLNLIILFIISIIISIKSTSPIIKPIIFWKDYLHSNNQLQNLKANNLNNLINYKTHLNSNETSSETYPIHSHNDYWRSIPLFNALELGINSVEADVWYLPTINSNELYVGHKKLLLSQYKTLDSLYLSNLETLLDELNQQHITNGLFNGVLKNSSKTLNLIIDIKTNANETFNQVLSQLKPFIDKNYLTFYDSTTKEWEIGPLTIHISGNIPYELIKSQEKRYTFIDSKLDSPEFQKQYNNELSIFTSSSLKNLIRSKPNNDGLTQEQLDILEDKFHTAQTMGIKTRIWDIPNHQNNQRDEITMDLLKIGVDMINCDDLKNCIKLLKEFKEI
ncbi:hypothetical protein BN7_3346 [Wickerhamomyces ciferrii]|uniref:Altered inheritance of mitochondria protein 6 n=1 Tax=Wickerhamomyces ciferrii (strain ATCC 14091 / BCRC 22168 / CBS 111 / JCM 3599 / NBRC 0793 / NRRL Y-1031 F-60-10) TaxID=1206466 RepID=K0KNR1_WICCF|nr:uncharacterized protein BN7_3346 [Wickerhamomyces ciferrii]CCH43792.1 hypothetical protein BN7_3346 [Wickerhamomyces ciferrii]